MPQCFAKASFKITNIFIEKIKIARLHQAWRGKLKKK